MEIFHVKNQYISCTQLGIQYCHELYDDGLDTPVINVTADIVELSKMRGYEDFAKFEQIHLGNAVDIYDYIHNFTLHERIVGLKYDCIRGYNTEVTISEPPKTAKKECMSDH